MLMATSQEGNSEVVRLLLAAGANVNAHGEVRQNIWIKRYIYWLFLHWKQYELLSYAFQLSICTIRSHTGARVNIYGTSLEIYKQLQKL